MSLLQMSISGGVLILAITVIRALALNRLPKRAFFLLWLVAALRLLVPVSVPSPVSVYSLAKPEIAANVEAAVVRRTSPPVRVPAGAAAPIENAIQPAVQPAAASGVEIPVWQIVWAAGSMVCAAFFIVSYVRCRRRFQESLPVERAEAAAWLAERRTLRTVDIRQSDAVSAPLTYGVFRPVILLPKALDWGERMAYVLEHELVHIQWFDAAWKLVFAAAACVHWWNPLAWVMYVLANRDIELSCDEAVVRRFGLGKKSAYAMALISMEETKNGLPPLASGFSKNAIEERITAIMKIKKTSIVAMLLAAVLVCGVTAGFATSAAEKPEDLRKYPTRIADGIEFTKEEDQRLRSLWIEGYEDMTVADYQEKMWTERDNPEDQELIDRFANCTSHFGFIDDEKANQAIKAYHDYFFNVYMPLTAEGWQSYAFRGSAVSDGSQSDDPGHPISSSYCASLGYTFTLHILDAEKLTVGEYEQTYKRVNDTLKPLLWERTEEELSDKEYMDAFLDQETDALKKQLSTDRLEVEISFGFLELADRAQLSESSAQTWAENLAPYKPFGLTWEYNDPDHDGNGLTMYYQGREVRGIVDEQEGSWMTEHAGNGLFAADAIELYTVYENGKLAGLRPATAEEQAEWDRVREENSRHADTNPPIRYPLQEEGPNAAGDDESEAEMWTIISDSIARKWDEDLAPYKPLGLTWEFHDPDHDGNGLTMHYQGREVRGIVDEQEGIWIIEHTGNSTYSADAIELYAVYENGKLTGLRPATAGEQAEWNRQREQNSRQTAQEEEQREFPNATAEDYASFLELMKWENDSLPPYASSPYRDYQDMTLSDFNMRLLEWGNDHFDAYDRIMCDVLWNDYAVELNENEKRFVALTCDLSGTENGMHVRSSYTGRPEEDPDFSESLPERMTAESGAAVAWCDLYYHCTYHIADKATVRVRERDEVISQFRQGVRKFWNETSMDELLHMTEEQVVKQLNSIAEEYSTDSVRITPMTTDDVQFETMDERGRN